MIGLMTVYVYTRKGMKLVNFYSSVTQIIHTVRDDENLMYIECKNGYGCNIDLNLYKIKISCQ